MLRLRKVQHHRKTINSMLLGKLFWVFCIRRRVPLKRKAGMPSKRHRNCQNSFVPQKIGSLNWKLRTSFIATGRSVPKNGFAEFTRKSKVGLSESHEATGRCPVGNVRLVVLMMRDDGKIYVTS
jgi:hypothetical protein